MKILKAQCAGNDFIAIEAEACNFDYVRFVCDRHFGIGADGVLCLFCVDGLWQMRIYNSDGTEPAFCGNGLLCAGKILCKKLDIVRIDCAVGGVLYTVLCDGDAVEGTLPMPRLISFLPDGAVLVDSGVPHLVFFRERLDDGEFEKRAPTLRRQHNANVCFAKSEGEHMSYRCFERGVEGETLACGSGAVAVAYAAKKEAVDISTWRNERLRVSFDGKHAYYRACPRIVFLADLVENGSACYNRANR